MIDDTQDRETVAEKAVAIAAPEDRETYIVQACGGDEEMKRQVEERVSARLRDGGAPQVGFEAEEGGPIRQVGPYKVLKEVGEGIAGVVFQAEQSDPEPLVVSAGAADPRPGVAPAAGERKPDRPVVALKVIKEGLDWGRIVERFEADRERLATIDEPRIARLLDAGTRRSGQPYFVSEWVDGAPITAYCDDHSLPIKRRLQLLAEVCEAVRSAHRKGVVHGDLKPSNVLVAEGDGDPAPKLLDLGVARATLRRPVERASAVGSGGHRDQPEYMSPDRADANSADVDTLTDVYGLGILLYELLTGSTPLPKERLKTMSMPEALRLIREDDPPTPSARLGESKDLAKKAASKRQKSPKALIDEVRGDLDCLVMKALSRDRSNRYPTVDALARDIRRYLDREPLEACPPDARAQFLHLARKHRGVSIAATMISALLLTAAVVGAAVGIWEHGQAEEARKARQQAGQKETKAEATEEDFKGKFYRSESARQAAIKELEKARAEREAAQRSEDQTGSVLAFFKRKMLSAGRPGDVSLAEAFQAGGLAKDVTLRKAADMAQADVAKSFGDQPLVEATVREMLGLTYLNIGEPAEAVKQFERALALREAMLGFNDPATANCRNQLAVAYRLANMPAEASRLFDHSPESPKRADALGTQGSALLLMKKPAEAEIKLREALTILDKIQPDALVTLDARSMLGEALVDQSKFSAAEPLLMSAYLGMKQLKAANSSFDEGRLTLALERLVRLYAVWGKKDDELRWKNELDLLKLGKKS